MTSELVFSDATELAERIRSEGRVAGGGGSVHTSTGATAINPLINAVVAPNESALDQARDG